MISKLPRWFWCGTWILGLIAGMINVIGLLGFSHRTVSHLTGNTSMLAAAIAVRDVSAISHFGLVIGSFLVGTVISGFVIQDSTLQLGRRYGLTMLFELFRLCLFSCTNQCMGFIGWLALADCKMRWSALRAKAWSGPRMFQECSPTLAFF